MMFESTFENCGNAPNVKFSDVIVRVNDRMPAFARLVASAALRRNVNVPSTVGVPLRTPFANAIPFGSVPPMCDQANDGAQQALKVIDWNVLGRRVPRSQNVLKEMVDAPALIEK